MNYLAHGIRFLDDPYLLAGTAVPDWLSVVDRRVRVRSRFVGEFLESADGWQQAVAEGIRQHLEDDRWFHQTRGFFEITGLMADEFRRVIGPDDGFRPGFLGHIVTELLLDAVLIQRHPERLDSYYELLGQVDPVMVQTVVNACARGSTDRLALFIERFRQVEFLRDYTDSERLLFRLNQVMRRIKLNPLPATVAAVFEPGIELIDSRIDELLLPEHFRL